MKYNYTVFLHQKVPHICLQTINLFITETNYASQLVNTLHYLQMHRRSWETAATSLGYLYSSFSMYMTN